MRVNPSDRIGGSAGLPKNRRVDGTPQRFRRVVVRALLLVVGIALGASLLLVVPLRWIDPMTTAFILADEHEAAEIQFEWMPWKQMSDSLPLAVIAAEDQRFFEHAGIDLESIRESVEESRRGEGLRGASTITQQVAKNLYLWRGRSFVRKGIEAWVALLIDLTWPKQRILEVYLNIAELGPGIYGAGAASEVYFGKTPAQVTDAEAALLAAVLPNPNRLDAGAPSAYVRERQRWIVGQMSRLRREQLLHEAGPST